MSRGRKVKDGEEKLSSVTHILNETMPQENRLALQASPFNGSCISNSNKNISLNPQQVWEEKMIRELGRDGFLRFRRALFARGHRLHSYVEARLLGDEEAASRAEAEASEDATSLRHLRSVRPRLEELQFPVTALEGHVMHRELGYQVG